MPLITFLRDHKDGFLGNGVKVIEYTEGQEIEASDDFIRSLQTHPDPEMLFKMSKEKSSAITKADVKEFDPMDFGAMSRTNVLALGVDGLRALTREQIAQIPEKAKTNLKKEQMKILEAKK